MKTFSTAPQNETLKPITCSICGSNKTKTYWDCGTYVFKKCLGCGVLYQNPQPIPQDIINRYDQDYYQYELQNEENFFKLMMLGLHDVGFVQFEASLARPRFFLDIGCATGRLLEEMRDRGWETRGVEVCEPSARHAREKRNLEVHLGTLETAPFLPKSFDAIHFSHVIEHINDPLVFLQHVHRLLKPGGQVFIVTPCYTGFQAQLFKRNWRSAIADHLYLFSKKTLTQILLKTGLKPLQYQTWGGLSVGMAPRWLKAIVDPLAKRFGFGDVIMVRAVRAEND